MRIIAVFCILGLVLPVSAIVVQDYGAAEAAPSVSGLDLDWGHVYNYKGSSAVAVGGGWLLTAEHVADDGGSGSLTIDGMVYTQQEIVPHPLADDLALVRYDKAFPGYYDLYTGSIPQSLTDPKLPVLMVGYGTTGTVSSASWTTVNGGAAWGRGTKRWGSQQIDITESEDEEFLMYFNSSRTAYEAGAGYGDSGSGVFYKDGDTWKLAGITVSIDGAFSHMNAMSMPYYADWVMDTIPEPAAIGLMGAGTIGLFLARTKRRRKLPGRSLFPIRGDEPMCDRFDAMEGSEKVEKRAYADYLADMLEMIHTSPLSVWMNTLHTRNKAFSNAVWRFFMAVFERASERKETVRKRSEVALARGLDAFLEGISCAFSKSWKSKKSVWSVKMGMRKGLDVFLEIVRWEQMESAFTRFKRGIRFYRHDD